LKVTYKYILNSALDIQYPKDRSSKLDVVYVSPPWGGIGYNLLAEYSLEYLYPDFNQVIQKGLEFSRI
jgi:hypothetical protein